VTQPSYISVYFLSFVFISSSTICIYVTFHILSLLFLFPFPFDDMTTLFLNLICLLLDDKLDFVLDYVICHMITNAY